MSPGAELRQGNDSQPVGIVYVNDIVPGSGPFGRAAAFGFDGHGQRLWAPRAAVPRLAAISGPAATVTVMAWVRLLPPPRSMRGGGLVGGVWEEDRSWRQYAIFMDGTGGCKARNGLVAHISGEGGPSPGQKYCESRACGATALAPGGWHCLANVYDGKKIQAFVNGTLDTSPDSGKPGLENPFQYPDPPRYPTGGIFTPPPGGGANFSLGANYIHQGGGVGPGFLSNKFVGLLGAYTVFDRALEAAELRELCEGGPHANAPANPGCVSHSLFSQKPF